MISQYKRIGLFDHMGWGNMGDAAILESFIINIRKRLPGAVLVGFSLYPDDTKQRHNIECYSIRWWHPRKSGSSATSGEAVAPHSRFRAIVKWCRPLYVLAKPLHDVMREVAHLINLYSIVRGLDLLIISGGGQLCELHGDLPYNVFKICVLARLSNTPVFILAVGAGVVERTINRFFVKWAVQSATYVSLRSVESQILVRNLGVNKETVVCPDPAYALDLQEYIGGASSGAITLAESQDLLGNLGVDVKIGDLSKASASSTEGARWASSVPLILKVGLNPMGFCDPRRWPRKDEAVYSKYLEKLTGFSTWILDQNYDLEIFTSDILTDILAIQDLKAMLVGVVSPDQTSRLTFRALPTLKELFSQINSFDCVITSKFHGVIFSHLANKPVIALSYMHKIDDLMRTLGHGRYCLDIEHFELHELIDAFKSMMNEREHLATLFRSISATYSDALRAHFDEVFGGEGVAGRCMSANEVASAAM